MTLTVERTAWGTVLKLIRLDTTSTTRDAIKIGIVPSSRNLQKGKQFIYDTVLLCAKLTSTDLVSDKTEMMQEQVTFFQICP